MPFAVNTNREFVADQYKNVLNKDTNEVLAFPINMSDDQINEAISSDTEGRPIADVNPTFYDAHVRPALEQAKITGNYDLYYDAANKDLYENPFVKAALLGATFGLTKDNSPEVQKQRELNPIATFTGDIVGQTASILATAGIGETVFGISKAAQGIGLAARGATPLAIRQAAVGSGEILANTAGQVIQKTATNTASASIVGALYEGISNSAEQGKLLYDDVEGKLQQDSPDLIKIGQSALHGAGLWGLYGGVGGVFNPKTVTGISAGTSAVAGVAYLASKAEGASEPDALLNASVMGVFHFVSHAQTSPEERKTAISRLQDTIAGYIQSKNQMTAVSNIHELAAKEFVDNHALDVINESNNGVIDRNQNPPVIPKNEAEVLNLKDEYLKAEARGEFRDEKPQVEKVPISGNFKDGHSVEILDYLAQYIPAENVATMSGEQRLDLANGSWQDLRDVSEKFASGQNPYARPILNDKVEITPSEDKISTDAAKARGENQGAIDEVASSPSLTKKLVTNISDNVFQVDKKASVKSKESSRQAVLKEEKSLTQEVNKKQGAINEEIQGQTNGQEKLLVKDQPEIKAPAGAASENPIIDGTGEMKSRGLSSAVESNAVAKKLTDGFGSLPEYRALNLDKQAMETVRTLNADYNKAFRIAMGIESAPEGTTPESFFVAIENRAILENDVNTLRELATNSRLTAEATTMGQRIRTLGERDPESPVGAIKEVQKTREDAVKKKLKSKTIEAEKTKIAKEIKKEIKKATPTKETWASFIDSIQC